MLPATISASQAAVLQSTLELERRGLGYMPQRSRWASARSLRRAGLLIATDGRHEDTGEEGPMFLLTRLGRYEARYPRGAWSTIDVGEGAHALVQVNVDTACACVQIDARGRPVALHVPAGCGLARLLRYVESVTGFGDVRPADPHEERDAAARVVSLLVRGERHALFRGVEAPPAIDVMVYRSALQEIRTRLLVGERPSVGLLDLVHEQASAALEHRTAQYPPPPRRVRVPRRARKLLKC